MSPNRKWLCAQMGAREHYAIPRALFAANALDGLMTDFWAGPGARQLARIIPTKTTHSLATRCHPGIPDALVQSWNARAIGWELRLKRMTQTRGLKGRYLGYCDVGRRFAQAMVRSLKARRQLPPEAVFFGYDTCSLEVMEYLKDRGVRCIVDQIDPCRAEADRVRAEQRAWPGWEERRLEIPEEFFERHEREWAIADRVMVNSEFTRDALLQQGVSGGKISVVPLCYQEPEVCQRSEVLKTRSRSDDRQPLTVLFLGQVILRKGIQYLVEAARSLEKEHVRFDVVGPLGISTLATRSAPTNLRFHGRCTRDDARRWYQEADVFVLPTVSDGFALTQIEAMANGLAVIATPNCGSVVTDGVDGFVVPPGDPESIARAIRRYLGEPALLERHRMAALRSKARFSLPALAADLARLQETL